MTAWNADPVIITVAPTGAEVTRADNPAVPYTPQEIAADAVAAGRAGAAMVHLHVREPDGTPSGRPELFRETAQLIRTESELVVMVSTGGSVEMEIEKRITGLECDPDVSGVETGSMNFGDDVFITPPAAGRGIIAAAGERGIKLEIEAFDVGHVIAALALAGRGELAAPLCFNLVFGVPGGIDASPEALAAMIRPLPPDARWTVTAVGRHQKRMLALAVLWGASGIRVGMEDNVYRARGVLAESNAQLVADAAALVTQLGREVATPAQARERLGIAARG